MKSFVLFSILIHTDGCGLFGIVAMIATTVNGVADVTYLTHKKRVTSMAHATKWLTSLETRVIDTDHLITSPHWEEYEGGYNVTDGDDQPRGTGYGMEK